MVTKLWVPVVLVFILFTVLFSSPVTERSEFNNIETLPDSALVEEAVDGDTVRIKGGKLIRYIGIDSPELRIKRGGSWVYEPSPYSEEAYDLNRRLVEGKSVRLEYDEERRDKYNRLLAYIYIGDLFVNGEMVRTGLARASIYPPNTRHAGLLISLEKDARESKRRIWSR